MYNAIGFEIDKYNLILLYKLWNITYYFFFFFNLWNIYQGNPPGPPNFFLHMPILLLHHSVYIFTLYIISMT